MRPLCTTTYHFFFLLAALFSLEEIVYKCTNSIVSLLSTVFPPFCRSWATDNQISYVASYVLKDLDSGFRS